MDKNTFLRLLLLAFAIKSSEAVENKYYPQPPSPPTYNKPPEGYPYKMDPVDTAYQQYTVPAPTPQQPAVYNPPPQDVYPQQPQPDLGQYPAVPIPPSYLKRKVHRPPPHHYHQIPHYSPYHPMLYPYKYGFKPSRYNYTYDNTYDDTYYNPYKQQYYTPEDSPQESYDNTYDNSYDGSYPSDGYSGSPPKDDGYPEDPYQDDPYTDETYLEPDPSTAYPDEYSDLTPEEYPESTYEDPDPYVINVIVPNGEMRVFGDKKEAGTPSDVSYKISQIEKLAHELKTGGYTKRNAVYPDRVTQWYFTAGEYCSLRIIFLSFYKGYTPYSPGYNPTGYPGYTPVTSGYYPPIPDTAQYPDCSKQYLLLDDGDRKVQYCGHESIPPAFRSNSKYISVKHFYGHGYTSVTPWEFIGIAACT